MASYRITMACKLKIKNPYIASFVGEKEFDSFKQFKEAISNSIKSKQLFPSIAKDGSIEFLTVESDVSGTKISGVTYNDLALSSLLLTRLAKDEAGVIDNMKRKVEEISLAADFSEENEDLLNAFASLAGTSNFKEVRGLIENTLNDINKSKKVEVTPQEPEDTFFYINTTQASVKKDTQRDLEIANDIEIARQSFLQSLDSDIVTVDGNPVPVSNIYLKVVKDDLSYIQSENIPAEKLNNVVIFFVKKKDSYERLYIKGRLPKLGQKVAFTTSPENALVIRGSIQLTFYLPNILNPIYQKETNLKPELINVLTQFKTSPQDVFHRFTIRSRFPIGAKERSPLEFDPEGNYTLSIVKEPTENERAGQIILSKDGARVPFYVRSLDEKYHADVLNLIEFAMSDASTLPQKQEISKYLNKLFLQNQPFDFLVTDKFIIKSNINISAGKIIRLQSTRQINFNKFKEQFNNKSLKKEVNITQKMLDGEQVTLKSVNNNKIISTQIPASEWINAHLKSKVRQFKYQGESKLQREYFASITFSKSTLKIVDVEDTPSMTVQSLLNSIDESTLSEGSRLILSLIRGNNLSDKINNVVVEFGNTNSFDGTKITLKTGSINGDILVHEIVHVLVDEWIENNSDSTEVAQLAEIARTISFTYGQTDSDVTLAKELLASLANGSIVDKLKSSPANKSILSQLAQVLKDLLKNIFPGSYVDTLYEEVVSHFLSISVGMNLQKGDVNMVTNKSSAPARPKAKNPYIKGSGATIDDQILLFKQEVIQKEGALYLDYMIKSIEGDLASLLSQDMLGLLGGQLSFDEMFESLYAGYYFERYDDNENLLSSTPQREKFLDLFLWNKDILKEIFFRETKLFTFTKVADPKITVAVNDTVEEVTVAPADTDNEIEQPVSEDIPDVTEQEGDSEEKENKAAANAALEGGAKKEMEFGRNANKYNFEEADKEIRYLIKMLPAIEMKEGKPKIYTLAERDAAVEKDRALGLQFFYRIPGDEVSFIRVSKDVNGSVELNDNIETWNRLSYMFKDKLSLEEMMQDTFKDERTLTIVPSFYALYSWLMTSNDSGDILNANEENLHIYTKLAKTFQRFSNPLSKTLNKDGIFTTVNEGMDMSVITDKLVNDRFRQFVIDNASEFYDDQADTFNLLGYMEKNGLDFQGPRNNKKIANILGFEFSDKIIFSEQENFYGFLKKFLITTKKANSVPLDITGFIRNDYVAKPGETLVDDKGKTIRKVSSINSMYKIIHQLQHLIEPYTFSPMVKNAEGENQSVYSEANSILTDAYIYMTRPLNEVKKAIPRAGNPLFERSLFRKALYDDQGNRKRNTKIVIGNYNGVSEVTEGQASKGALNVDLTERLKVLTDFHNFLTKNECENTRAQVATTSYYIKLETKGVSNMLFSRDISSDAFKYPSESHTLYETWYNYLLGELEEIEGLPEEQRKLFLFDTKMIPEKLQKKILTDGAAPHKEEFIQAIHNKFKSDALQYKAKFLEHGGGYLIDPSGIVTNEITRGIKDLMSGGSTLEEAQDIMFFHFIINKHTMYVEELILFQGSLRNLSDKKYHKRSNVVQSGRLSPTTSPILRNIINERLNRSSVASALKGKVFQLQDTFKSATLSDYVIVSDVESAKAGYVQSIRIFYDSLGISVDDSYLEQQADTLLDKYNNVNVQDGSGRINPDAYIGLLMGLGAKPEMFKAYRALMLDMIYNKELYFKEELDAGVLSQEFVERTLTTEEIAEMEEGLALIEKEKIVFPSLKWVYRGGVVRPDASQKVADEALDKFSLFPLFIQYVYDKPVLKAELLGMINQGLAYIKVESGSKLYSPKTLTNVVTDRTKDGFEVDFSSSTHELLTLNLGEQILTPTTAKTENTFGSQFKKLILSGLSGLNLDDIKTLMKGWDVTNQRYSAALREEVLKEFGIENNDFANVDLTVIARVLKLHARSRELSKNVIDFLEGVESGKYTDFSASFNKKEVENLIGNIAKRIAVQKLTGSQLIQVASSQDDDLRFYSFEDGKVIEAECKVTLMGSFLNLLNLPEVQSEIKKEKTVNIVSKVRVLNRLLKDPEFRQKYKKELTIATYRIPTQGFNSMDVFVIKEFLPTFQGPQIVLPPEAVVKSGTDYDYDKAPSIFPVIGKNGRLIEGTVPTKSLKNLKDKKKDLENKLNSFFGKNEKLNNFFAKLKASNDFIANEEANFEILSKLWTDSITEQKELEGYLKEMKEQEAKGLQEYIKVKNQIYLKKNSRSLYQNELLQQSIDILTHPINYFRLITPNSDSLVMDSISTAFKEMGIDTAEPKGSDIVNYLVNLRKWNVVKGKDLLGVAATNNVLITLLQLYKASFSPEYFVRYTRNQEKFYFASVHYGLLTDQERDSILKNGRIDASILFDHSGILKQEWLSQLINVTVDMPGNDKFGFSNFNLDNFGAAIYLIVVQGVPFDRIVKLFHQPAVYQYHRLVEKYRNTEFKAEDRNYSLREARLKAMADILGMEIPKKEIKTDEAVTLGTFIYEGEEIEVTPEEVEDFNVAEELFHSIMEEQKTNVNLDMVKSLPFTRIEQVYDKSLINEAQKDVLMYYLSVLNEGGALRKVNSVINFDRAPDNLLIKVLDRMLLKEEVVNQQQFINEEFIDKVEEDSMISGVNVSDIIESFSKAVFPTLYNNVNIFAFKELLSKTTNKESFYNKVTNDFLSSIVQNFAYLEYGGQRKKIKDIADPFLIGKSKYVLVRQAKELLKESKAKGKHIRLLDIMVNSTAKKSRRGAGKINNIQLFLGFENSNIDKDRLTEEFRQLLADPKTKDFATALAAVGIVQSGYSKSPLFFSDIIPPEFITPSINEALNTYNSLPNKLDYALLFAEAFKSFEGKMFRRYQIKEVYRYKSYTFKKFSDVTALPAVPAPVQPAPPVEYTPYEEVETRTVEVIPSQSIPSSGEVTREEQPISLKGKMTYEYGANKRSDVISTTTFDAILNGERMATTRYESQGNLEYWKQAKVGDVITWESNDGRTVQVRVTKSLHPLKESGKTAEQWSKLEGWSVEYFNKNVIPKLNEAWQLEFELIQPSQKQVFDYETETEKDSKKIIDEVLEYIQPSEDNPSKQSVFVTLYNFLNRTDRFSSIFSSNFLSSRAQDEYKQYNLNNFNNDEAQREAAKKMKDAQNQAILEFYANPSLSKDDRIYQVKDEEVRKMITGESPISVKKWVSILGKSGQVISGLSVYTFIVRDNTISFYGQASFGFEGRNIAALDAVRNDIHTIQEGEIFKKLKGNKNLVYYNQSDKEIQPSLKFKAQQKIEVDLKKSMTEQELFDLFYTRILDSTGKEFIVNNPKFLQDLRERYKGKRELLFDLTKTNPSNLTKEEADLLKEWESIEKLILSTPEPKVATTALQPSTPIPSVVSQDEFKYYGTTYKISLDENKVAVDVPNLKQGQGETNVKFQERKQKILDSYNTNPDVDPQNGRKFRNLTPDPVYAEPKEKERTVVVPKGSNPNNKEIYRDDDFIYLMNDDQQRAYDTIKPFIIEKLKNRKRVTNEKVQFTDPLAKKYSDVIPQGMWNNMIGLAGKGGTGKTTVINKIIEDAINEYSESMWDRVQVQYVGPTHTSVTALQESLKLDSEYVGGKVKTIQSFVLRNVPKGDPSGIESKSDLWLLNESTYLQRFKKSQIPSPISQQDIVIVDESSMVSQQAIEDMMSRLTTETSAYYPIFIFMGDYRQLPPISEERQTQTDFNEGIISATLFSSINQDKFVELSQVMRSSDEFFHRIFDSVGDQIKEQRKALVSGQTIPEFKFEPYDKLTSSSTSNMLIAQEKQVDAIIDMYTEVLAKEENPDEIFWVHYNRSEHATTLELSRKIRAAYFKKIGQVVEGPKIQTGDYALYTGSLPYETIEDDKLKISKGILKPQSRIKILDKSTKEVTLSPTMLPFLYEVFGPVKINSEEVLFLNRQHKTRKLQGFEKDILKVGKYDTARKTQELLLKDSSGVIHRQEIFYGKYLPNKEKFLNFNKSIFDQIQPSYIGSSHTVQGKSIKKVIVGDYNLRANSAVINKRDMVGSLYTMLTRAMTHLIIIKPNQVPIDNNQNVFELTLNDNIKPSNDEKEDPCAGDTIAVF